MSVIVHDTKLSYLEAGQGDAVVFIHGWPTNAHLWRDILPSVAAEGRRAIAIDLPGFGDSDKPDASYSFRYDEDILDGFLDEIGVGSLALVVHDLGGPIGLFWMSHNLSRVTELAILNTVIFPEMSWAVKLFVAATRTPGLRSYLTSPSGIRGAMRLGVKETSRITDEIAALYQDPYRDEASRTALLAAGHGLHPGGFQTIVAALPEFTGPVRGIYGEHDRFLPDITRTMERLTLLLPQIEVAALRDAGHFLQEDAPDEVAAILASFLKHTPPIDG